MNRPSQPRRQVWQNGRAPARRTPTTPMNDTNPQPFYLSPDAQQRLDTIAQQAARSVILALKLSDETATWQLLRKTLTAPLAVAYDHGASDARP